MKEVKVKLSNLDITPRKTRSVSRIIIGMPVGDAEAELMFRKERAAVSLLKLLRSAVANVASNKNKEMKIENLYVKNILVDKGIRLKRSLPRAQGRATPLHKQRCHVILILSESSEKKSRFKFVGKKKDKKITRKALSAAKGRFTAKGQPKKKELQTAKKEEGKEQRIEKPEKPNFYRRIFRRKAV